MLKENRISLTVLQPNSVHKCVCERDSQLVVKSIEKGVCNGTEPRCAGDTKYGMHERKLHALHPCRGSMRDAQE